MFVRQRLNGTCLFKDYRSVTLVKYSLREALGFLLRQKMEPVLGTDRYLQFINGELEVPLTEEEESAVGKLTLALAEDFFGNPKYYTYMHIRSARGVNNLYYHDLNTAFSPISTWIASHAATSHGRYDDSTLPKKRVRKTSKPVRVRAC